MKKNILFLCTGNSCRSQIAEGFGKRFHADKFNFFSAGTKTHGLNPNAISVMKEIDIDISTHKSQLLSEFDDLKIDYVFTVCSSAKENCPYLPGVKNIHVGFDDPPTLTKDMKEDHDILEVYRRVRDEIGLFVKNIESYLGEK